MTSEVAVVVVETVVVLKGDGDAGVVSVVVASSLSHLYAPGRLTHFSLVRLHKCIPSSHSLIS